MATKKKTTTKTATPKAKYYIVMDNDQDVICQGEWDERCSLDSETTTGVVNVKWDWTRVGSNRELKAHQKPLGADQHGLQNATIT